MVIAPTDFRDEELLEPKAFFEAEGAVVEIASTTAGLARGLQGGDVKPDLTVAAADPHRYAAIVVVGGAGAPTYLWENGTLHALLRVTHADGIPVAAICLSGGRTAAGSALAEPPGTAEVAMRHEVARPVRFRDRGEGGRRLVERLRAYRGRPRTVVLGLPRGGVVPAAEIAAALELPLGVVIVRKLRAPGNSELAIGAVAEGGEFYLNEEGQAFTVASEHYVSREIEHQREEIAARQRRFRGGGPLVLPDRATVILVDDGVATGSTVIGAIRALRRHRPERLVLAIPVAPPDAAAVLRGMVDELVVLATPEPFGAVGAFYDEFPQVSDDEVTTLLARAAASAA